MKTMIYQFLSSTAICTTAKRLQLPLECMNNLFFCVLFLLRWKLQREPFDATEWFAQTTPMKTNFICHLPFEAQAAGEMMMIGFKTPSHRESNNLNASTYILTPALITFPTISIMMRISLNHWIIQSVDTTSRSVPYKIQLNASFYRLME